MPHGDVTHIEIPVADLATATEFYSALFGWSITETPGLGIRQIRGLEPLAR